MAEEILEYRGNKQPAWGEQDPVTGQLRYPYLPDATLVEAVNLAIYLERPLLLKGEPGCGKTRLAHAVAYELGLPLRIWPVKSTSRAQDGLYRYDAVARLRDAQLAASDRLTVEELARSEDVASYVRMGALGEAFEDGRRSLVLIDEIDKADIDFPNDLLMELDEQRFVIEETGREVRAQAAPIVFITSNDEKDLPDAFLRRCLFYYVQFPKQERLMGIVRSFFPQLSDAVVKRAVARFSELREQMQRERGVRKKVSTSELIDWVKVLKRYSEEEALAKLEGQLPFPEVLLKSWEDHKRYLGEHNE